MMLRIFWVAIALIIGIGVLPMLNADAVKALLVIGLYCLPGLVAFKERHHNAKAILLLNILLGWTLLGWIGALIWAFTRPSPTATPVKSGWRVTKHHDAPQPEVRRRRPVATAS